METTYAKVLITGLAQALRNGVPSREAEDCASAFRIKFYVLHCKDPEHAARIANSSSLLNLFAKNHAINHRIHYFNNHEVLEADAIHMDGSPASWQFADNHPSPHGELQKREFREEFANDSKQCQTSASAEVFIRHFLEELTAEEISNETGNSISSIHEIIYRGRKKMRKLFEERGIHSNDLRESLPESTPEIDSAFGLDED